MVSCGRQTKALLLEEKITLVERDRYAGFFAHRCALKEALSSQVYLSVVHSRRADTREHIYIVGRRKEIPDKLRIRDSRAGIPSVPYRTSHRSPTQGTFIRAVHGKGPSQFLREIKPISAGSLLYRIVHLFRLFDAYSSLRFFFLTVRSPLNSIILNTYSFFA